jgi:hypothetical protein
MIYIFSTELTDRMDYVFRLLFETILDEKIEFCQDETIYANKTGIKINYSNNQNLDGLQLNPHSLLFEKVLHPQSIEVFEWGTMKAFFGVENSFLPFDIFAASFYLVSRYEEYLPGKRDRHNRYLSRNSLACQHHFLEKPLVNCWALKMASLIEEQNEGFTFKKSKFSYIPTFDIDNAWAYKNKGILLNSVAAFRDLFLGKFKSVKKRLSVVFSLKKDPYDTYDFMRNFIKNNGLRPKFFILINKKGKHDRSLSFKNKSFRKLIHTMSKWGEIGIHPSYNSNESDKQLKNEIKRLNTIIGEEVKISRQHYLKISFPRTYRQLIENGIETDYSLGYASRPGFRASICTPFNFFDLLENKSTTLSIVPFQVMDGTLLHYRNMTPADAFRKIKTLMNETASVGGTFVSLWHNESLSDEGEWKGWKQVYTDLTQLAVELNK